MKGKHKEAAEFISVHYGSTYQTMAQVLTTFSDHLTVENTELYKALKTVVRQISGGHPVGHDAFLAASRAINRYERNHKVEMKHQWKGQQQGGDPTEIDSCEWVCYCDNCGVEMADDNKDAECETRP